MAVELEIALDDLKIYCLCVSCTHVAPDIEYAYFMCFLIDRC